MLTVNDLYLKARRALADAGVSMPELEARELAGLAATIKAGDVMAQSWKYAPEAAGDSLDKLLGLRLAGTPLAHLLGEWDFLGLTLKVTPDVLIPRSDTETLALETVERCRAAGAEPRLLDLCSGSGCVGLSVASRLSDARITFCDISERAMDIARENCRRFDGTGFGGIFSFVLADALAAPPRALRGFDAIACNPPYIADAEWESLDRGVRDYEPKLALVGGSDGLDFYRAVACLWKNCLCANGSLLFEVGAGQADGVAGIMSAAGFSDIVKIPDLSGVERVVAGLRRRRSYRLTGRRIASLDK